MNELLSPESLFMELFVHRSEAHAIQIFNGQKTSYSSIKLPLNEKVIAEHLKGNRTVGTYQYSKDSTCKWICYDFDGTDLKEQLQYAKLLYLHIRDDLHIESVALEFSGKKGYHVWIFLPETNGWTAKHWAAAFAKNYGVHEIFPKQDAVDVVHPYGNLVKLPLGVHRETGKRSCLLDEHFQELSLDDSLKLLAELATKTKPVLREVERVQHAEVKLPERSETKRDIPVVISRIIGKGATVGRRYSTLWLITKELHLCGWNKEDILHELLTFNRNCMKPHTEKEVSDYLDTWFKDPKKHFESYKSIVAADEAEAQMDKFEELTKLGMFDQVSEPPQSFLFFEDIPEPGPPEWLVDGLIPLKGITIIAGQTGCMKSFCTQEIISAIMNNRQAFGQFNTKQGKIILIDNENDFATLSQRIRGLGNIPQKQLILFDPKEMFNLDSDLQVDRLLQRIKEENPIMVIFDTFRRCFMGNEIDSEKINSLFVSTLGQIAKERAVIILHHSKKKMPGTGNADEISDVRGSTDIVGFAVSVLMLRKNNDDVTVQPLKMRQARTIEPFTVKLVNEDGRFRFQYSQGTNITLVEEQQCANLLKDYLVSKHLSGDAMTTKSIKDGFKERHEFKDRSVTAAISILRERGFLKRESKGKYTLLYGDDCIGNYI